MNEREHVEIEEHKGPWCATSITCFICLFHWVGVHPASCTHLECPRCRFLNEVPIA